MKCRKIATYDKSNRKKVAGRVEKGQITDISSRNWRQEMLEYTFGARPRIRLRNFLDTPG